MTTLSKFQTLCTKISLILAATLLLSACAAPMENSTSYFQTDKIEEQHEDHEGDAHAEELLELSAVSLAAGEKLHVVVTTNILGDVVQTIGSELIELTILLPVGADPHSYNATSGALRLLSTAHIIFIIGEGVEESMHSVLENREGDAPLVAVNIGIDLLEMDEKEHVEDEEHAEDEEDHHHGLDPHTWTSVANVIHWVETIAHSLGTLDPANGPAYETAAAVYMADLEALDTEIQTAVSTIPQENRKLVTDHETFGYFAARYGFEVVGAIIPSFSTLAAPSAQELAALQDQITAEGVKALFVGSTVNPVLAEQIAGDLGVVVIPLYTDSLSAQDGPAATYIEMMRYNVNAVVEALK